MASRNNKAGAQKPAASKAAASATTRMARTAIEQATKTANSTIEGTTTMNTETLDRVQETQAATAERFTAAFGDVNERSREAMQKSARLVEEMTNLTKGNVEALVASSKVAARGVEQLSQEAAEFSRRSFEQASATLKSFTEVRSPTDFFKLQSDYARSAFDTMVAESSKMSEAVIKLAGEVAEPMTSRVAVAADRVKNVAL
jgi:phasin family protein